MNGIERAAREIQNVSHHLRLTDADMRYLIPIRLSLTDCCSMCIASGLVLYLVPYSEAQLSPADFGHFGLHRIRTHHVCLGEERHPPILRPGCSLGLQYVVDFVQSLSTSSGVATSTSTAWSPRWWPATTMVAFAPAQKLSVSRNTSVSHTSRSVEKGSNIREKRQRSPSA